MCPCISSKSEYATCCKSECGLMSPSLQERENYCFGVYELCPLFSASYEENKFGYRTSLELVGVESCA